MSAILLIHQVDKNGHRVNTFKYHKSNCVTLVNVTRLDQLVDNKPTVYQTGMTALATQKKLEKVLAKLSNDNTGFVIERMPYYDSGVTAYSRIRNGAVPPTHVRGG